MEDNEDSTMTQQLAVTRQQGGQLAIIQEPMSVKDIVRHTELIKGVMKEIMTEGVHYGNAGNSQGKPVLLQPGAQVLCVTFRFVPKFLKVMTDLGDGHREWIVDCPLVNMAGVPVGYGVGSCSTMEDKYRWRNDGSDGESTGKKLPGSYWALKDPAKKALTLRQITQEPMSNLGIAKMDDAGHIIPKGSAEKGEWMIVRYPKDRKRVENESIADTWNTVLKIACKRALVHATLNTTGASDVFTQDLEDWEPEAEPPHTGGHSQEQEREPAADTTTKQESAKQEAASDPGPAVGAGDWTQALVTGTDGNTYKLGRLSLMHLEAVKANMVDKMDMKKATKEQKLFAIHVQQALDAKRAGSTATTPETHPLVTKQAEDKAALAKMAAERAAAAGETPAPSDPPADTAPRPNPAPPVRAGTGEPPPPFEWPADAIKRLREMCEENVITEATFFEYAEKYNLLPPYTPGEEIVSFDDDRLNLAWLQDAHDMFALKMMQWGLKARPGQPLPTTEPPPKKTRTRAPGAAPKKPTTPAK